MKGGAEKLQIQAGAQIAGRVHMYVTALRYRTCMLVYLLAQMDGHSWRPSAACCGAEQLQNEVL